MSETAEDEPTLIDALFFLGTSIFMLGGWLFLVYITRQITIVFIVATVLGIILSILVIRSRADDFDAVNWRKRENTPETILDRMAMHFVPYGGVIGLIIATLLSSIIGKQADEFFIGMGVFPGIVCFWMFTEHLIHKWNNRQ